MLFGDRAYQFLSLPKANEHGPEGYAPVNVIECAVKTAFLAEQKAVQPNPCYYYRFNPEIPGDDRPGSFHSVDLWFFFETLAKCTRPFRGKHYDLARQMCNYWANFIKTGDPNGKDDDGEDLPVWRHYTGKDTAEMLFIDEGAVPSEENCAFTRFVNQHIYRQITGEDL